MATMACPPNAPQIISRVFGDFPPQGTESVSRLIAVGPRLAWARRGSNADGDYIAIVPGFDGCASLGEAQENMLVTALVAEAAIEGFNECILHRLARRDGVPVEPPD
jgi:hypothetical protein